MVTSLQRIEKKYMLKHPFGLNALLASHFIIVTSVSEKMPREDDLAAGDRAGFSVFVIWIDNTPQMSANRRETLNRILTGVIDVPTAG